MAQSRGITPSRDDFYTTSLTILDAYVLFLSGIEALTLLLSVCGLRIGQLISVIILAVSASAAFLRMRSLARARARSATCRGTKVVLAGGVAIYAVLTYFSLHTPDLTCDGNIYHIPVINYWARHGGVYWIDADWTVLFNGYPKGVELLGYIFGLAFGTSRVINAINLLFLPLGIFGVVALSRRLGASAFIASAAGLLYLLVPINIFQTQTTYVDVGFGSSVVALLAVTIAALDVIPGSIDYSPLAWAKRTAILGCAAGLALGGKGSAPIMVALAMASSATVAIVKSLSAERRWITIVNAAWGLAAAMAVAIVVGGYWYIRNYIHGGSPIYPVGITIGRHVIFPGVSAAQVTNEEAMLPPELKPLSAIVRVLVTWIQSPTQWPGSMEGYQSRLGGLGFIWIIGCVPAIVYAFVTAAKARKDLLAALFTLLSIVGVSFCVIPMSWWPRYTIWIYGLGLPCFALVAQVIADRARALRPIPIVVRIGVIWIAGCLALCGLEGLISIRAVVHGAQLTRPKDYLFPETNGTILDQIIDSDDAVAVGPLEGESFGRWKTNLFGLVSLPIGRRDMLEKYSADPIIANVGKGLHVHYVIWDDKVTVPDALRHLAVRVVPVPGFVVLVMPQ